MRLPGILLSLVAIVPLSGCLDMIRQPAGNTTDPALVELGRQLFHDPALSVNGSQSCSTCHADTTAFTDPDSGLSVSAGALPGRSGTRNAPTAAYAAFIPPLHAEREGDETLWVGGLFLDGRADSLEAQAGKPLFNPDEMALADADDLLAHLRTSGSRAQFEAVYGSGSLAAGATGAETLARVTRAIAAFERSPALAPFSSKFDAWLAGKATLDADETEGMAVFARADKGNCAACHAMNRGPHGEPPLFTDFTYDNLGVPRNPDTTFFAPDFVDPGLEATLLARGVEATPAAALRGKFRVPTLRNVARTAPYMHNGVFADLRTVIDFYNTRDTDPARWAAIGDTEVPSTVNHEELGHLGLRAHEVDVLLAFLGTLNDGYFIP